MKLTKQFISLAILASSTFAIKVSYPNVQINNQIKQLTKVKRKLTVETFGEGEEPVNPFGTPSRSDSDDISNAISNECMKSLNKYNEFENCLSIFNSVEKMKSEKKSNNICKIFNQKQCQNFYQTNIFDSPECESSDAFAKSLIENSIYSNYLTMSVNCGKDENDKYCPLTEAYLSDVDTDSYSDKNIILNDLTKKTCESKLCTESIVKFFEEYDKSNQELLEDIKNNKEMDKKKKEELLNNLEQEIEKDPLNVIRDYLKSGNCSYAVFTEINNKAESRGTTTVIPQYTSPDRKSVV